MPSTQVIMETNHGTIKIALEDDKAPATVANFLKYVDEKFYDNTIFHRVIKDFMVQGGGFEPGMKQKTTHAMVENESANGLSNARGTLAMARTSAPHSASAQFFINTVDNAFLDRAQAHDGFGYCVFARVTEGMDVVDKIRGVSTTRRGSFDDLPMDNVMIQSIRRA